jgi:hypothetical protein
LVARWAALSVELRAVLWAVGLADLWAASMVVARVA